MYIIFLLLFLITPILMVIGVINPSSIKSITKTTLPRKKIGLWFSSATIIWFILFRITTPHIEQKILTKEKETISVHSFIDKPQKEITKNIESHDRIEEDPSTNDQNEIEEKSDYEEEVKTTFYTVSKVVDGDTFDVLINGENLRIRPIGMDTPETVDPRKPVQCFGIEASKKATELLKGQRVRLEKDPTQGELDKYGRALMFVFLEDGLFFNKWMIENGYAYEYTYNTPYKYINDFKASEKHAREEKLGLWGDICNKTVDTTKTTTSPEPIETAPLAPTPISPSTQKDVVDTNSCNIKGNISSDGRKLYHYAGCPSYSRTKISESKGERWFCSEQEAINAGWVKAGNC